MEVECHGRIAGRIGQPGGRLEFRRLGQRYREHRLEQLLLVAEVAVDPFLASLRRPRLRPRHGGPVGPLVVQDRDGRLVAALHAVSLPPAIVASAADRGVPFEVMIAALTAVVKIRAVAVDESSRGQGIGSALLTRCLHLYFQLGFGAAYGQFRTGSGLETFYARQGFDVLDEGAVFSLRDRLGLPFRIQADPGERIFTRVRGG
ncbi:GNAT family N-acetyltransferase [Streptosporangium sandarakinum]|uniref:GNAT family N-acetyltransferase n=1 Tax=Streptosporangium sandarakinum TaxID=1260955 RepID=UPI0033B4D4A1